MKKDHRVRTTSMMLDNVKFKRTSFRSQMRIVGPTLKFLEFTLPRGPLPLERFFHGLTHLRPKNIKH